VKPELIVLNFFLRPPSSVLMIHQSRRIHFVKSYLVKIMKQSVSSRANKFEQCRNFCNVRLLLAPLTCMALECDFDLLFSATMLPTIISKSVSESSARKKSFEKTVAAPTTLLGLQNVIEKAKYCIHLATLNLICSPLSIC
jgi:hypothetical protein